MAFRANDSLASVLANRSGNHIDAHECRFPTFNTLCIHSIHPPTLVACRVGVGDLMAMGADTPHKLRLLGFDAIDLLDAEFFDQVTARFGCHEIGAAFITSPGDCVAIAGTSVQQTLGFTFVQLLRKCKGCPVHARTVTEEVLRQHHVQTQTIYLSIRIASPLAESGAAQALLYAQVSLAQCRYVEGQVWLDLETSGLSLDDRYRLGLPVLRIGGR